MTTDFEHDLREALQREAACAPPAPVHWSPDLLVDRESPHRSRWPLVTAAGLIAVAGVAGLILSTRDQNPAPPAAFATTPATVARAEDINVPTTHDDVEAPGPIGAVPTTLVSFERITFTQSFEAECNDPLDNRGWNTMTVVAMADLAGQSWRNEFIYPDGATRSLIAFGDPWYPSRTAASGEALGATLGCASEQQELVMTAEPGQGYFYSLNPMAPPPPSVQPNPDSPVVPALWSFRESATQQPGQHSDSLNRTADLWSLQIQGFGGFGDTAALTQTEEWFVNPSTGDVLERHFTQHIDGIGTAEWTATVTESGTITVIAQSMTDPYTASQLE